MSCLFRSPWCVFIKERFSLLPSLSMILLFVIANGKLASYFMEIQLSWERYLGASIIALSFFFRLRLFDELKDYETDKKVNPERPLARGLLSFKQVHRMAYALIGFEIILTSFMDLYALIPLLLAIGYSLLMYNEFFIGEWLRSQLVLYATTHTLVSTFLGFALASIITEKALGQFPVMFLASGLMNWNLFNLFEFSRKTFAVEEERLSVETYTSLYGLGGAVKLSLSQAFLAAILCEWMIGQVMIFLFWGLMALCISGAIFISTGMASTAKAFRALSGLYIIYIFIIIIYSLWDR